jgi:macrolide-specific efflux system membrane fusion protein
MQRRTVVATPDVAPGAPSSSAAGVPIRRRFLAHRRLLAVGTALAVLAAVVGWRATRSSGAAATTRVVPATLGTIQQTLSATGTIAAANQANLSFAVSGRVAAVDVTVGQTVTARQPVASVGTTALTAQVAEAEATLAAAQARLSSDQSPPTPISPSPARRPSCRRPRRLTGR